MGRATDWTAEGDSWKSEVTGSGEKSGRPACPSRADIENVGSVDVDEAEAGAGAGVTAS